MDERGRSGVRKGRSYGAARLVVVGGCRGGEDLAPEKSVTISAQWPKGTLLPTVKPILGMRQVKL